MATPTTGSPNITILDSKITANLATGNFIIDVTPSTFVTGGAVLVKGASVKIVNPLGVTVKDYPTVSYDILPPMTGSKSVAMPLVAANYLYGDYEITVRLTDAVDNVYTIEKKVNVCPPNALDKSQKQGCLDVDITSKCAEGKVIFELNQVPLYKGTISSAQVNSVTVYYPTESNHLPTVSTISSFSVPIFEGEYTIKGTVNATYNYADNIFYVIPYKINKSKQVRCQVDECCIQRYKDSLYVISQSDCTEKEKIATGELIGQVIFLEGLAKGAQDCGNDPSEYILQLEKLSGYVCSCDCNGVAPFIANAPVNDFNITGCNITSTVVANTKTFNVPLLDYRLVTSDPNVTLGIPVNNVGACERTQSISVVNDPTTCADIEALFTTNDAQKNTVAATAYSFLAKDAASAGCDLKMLSAPTGFAVTGNTRVSAFGKMEWYATLTLANTAAVSGETVLIFNDTIEPLIAKTGVHYEGIGVHRIGQLIINTYKGKISNLIIDMNFGTINTLAIDFLGLSYIEFYNVDILAGTNVKFLNIFHNVVIKGGNYYLNVNISGGLTNFPKLSHCRIYGDNNSVSQSGTLTNFYIENNELTNPTGKTLLYALGSSTDPDLYATVKDGLIVSKSYHCFDTIFSVLVSNVVAENITGRGIYIHSGGDASNCNVVVTGCTAKSKTGTAFWSVNNNAILFNPNAITNINISNCAGFSSTGTGMLLINGNLRNCYGYSETSYGINIGGSDRPSSDSHILNCVGESKESIGLKIDRDCFVYGGTFISRGTTINANPISVREDTGNVRTDNYNLIGVITIQHSLTAFSIKNAGHTPSIRISGCQFTSPYFAINVPGIDPTLSLRAVAIDAFGNAR